MIPQFFLSVIGGFVKLVFSILPDVPAMPMWVSDSLDAFMTVVLDGVALVSYLYSPLILAFIFTTAVVIINFEYLYRSTMWIVHKLPWSVH